MRYFPTRAQASAQGLHQMSLTKAGDLDRRVGKLITSDTSLFKVRLSFFLLDTFIHQIVSSSCGMSPTTSPPKASLNPGNLSCPHLVPSHLVPFRPFGAVAEVVGALWSNGLFAPSLPLQHRPLHLCSFRCLIRRQVMGMGD